jgi:predicted transcriptional regulator
MTIPETTRRASYEKTKAGLGARQLEIVNLLESHPHGLSSWEMANFLSRPIYVVRPRITELQSFGMIEATSVRYHVPTDRHEAVWTIKKKIAGELF